ncbi:hypothetical protein LIS77_10750 [Cytobacillus firmus]|uniref:hypothetical protein n=1 Tax=Cytobacillus firmus TaxID=1399 RepID=UPI002079C8A3|nr:hypothetical protein [Cytobacillus firmus]USK40940.1 hypothetical protein LIS77_10750 [Cytobacillus firmus]
MLFGILLAIIIGFFAAERDGGNTYLSRGLIIGGIEFRTKLCVKFLIAPFLPVIK